MTAGRWRPRLAGTIAEIAAISGRFEDDWWIIGSAAAALSGADLGAVGDVDLLLSERDARRLLDLWAGARRSDAAPDVKFRSAVFARFEATPLPVEAFGGFEMKIRGRWRAVLPLTREARGEVFTPSVAEQIALLQAMGRDKDGARIAALKRLL
jgi:hypothetical protein